MRDFPFSRPRNLSQSRSLQVRAMSSADGVGGDASVEKRRRKLNGPVPLRTEDTEAMLITRSVRNSWWLHMLVPEAVGKNSLAVNGLRHSSSEFIIDINSIFLRATLEYLISMGVVVS